VVGRLELAGGAHAAATTTRGRPPPRAERAVVAMPAAAAASKPTNEERIPRRYGHFRGVNSVISNFQLPRRGDAGPELKVDLSWELEALGVGSHP
jgi:hypothetical protein